MSGLDAISASNGWEFALLGVSIVFSGLVILSLVISQLHKLLNFWDNRASVIKKLRVRRSVPTPPDEKEPEHIEEPRSLAEAMRQYKMLVNHIGEPFSLPKLLKMAERSGLHRPHATINDLLRAGKILPDDTGYYVWKS